MNWSRSIRSFRAPCKTGICVDLRQEYEMAEKLIFEVGDIVKLKKPHPCGSKDWEVLRVGADFRLKCMGCGHQVMVTRKLVEKNARGLRKPS